MMPGGRIPGFLLCALMLAACQQGAESDKQDEEDETPAIPVETATATRSDVYAMYSGTAPIEALEDALRGVKAEGRLVQAVRDTGLKPLMKVDVLVSVGVAVSMRTAEDEGCAADAQISPHPSSSLLSQAFQEYIANRDEGGVHRFEQRGGPGGGGGNVRPHQVAHVPQGAGGGAPQEQH